jgi:hypothetical protein
MQQKLQELIRRGTPADLAEANELMKILAGYVSNNSCDNIKRDGNSDLLKVLLHNLYV